MARKATSVAAQKIQKKVLTKKLSSNINKRYIKIGKKAAKKA